jgi:hypothetical protein
VSPIREPTASPAPELAARKESKGLFITAMFHYPRTVSTYIVNYHYHYIFGHYQRHCNRMTSAQFNDTTGRFNKIMDANTRLRSAMFEVTTTCKLPAFVVFTPILSTLSLDHHFDYQSDYSLVSLWLFFEQYSTVLQTIALKTNEVNVDGLAGSFSQSAKLQATILNTKQDTLCSASFFNYRYLYSSNHSDHHSYLSTQAQIDDTADRFNAIENMHRQSSLRPFFHHP